MKILLGFTILIWSFGQVQAQANTFSLAEAQNYALTHSTQLKNAHLSVQEARKKVGEVRSYGLPQLHGELSYQNFITLPTSLVPAEFFGGAPGEFAELQFGTEQNMKAGVTASQMIFNGSYFVGLQASKLYVDLFKKQLAQSEIEIKANVARAYYAVLVSAEQVELMQKSANNMRHILTETEAFYEQGFVEEIEVDRIRIAYANVKSHQENAVRQADLARNVLKFQMGMPFQEVVVLTDKLDQLYSDDEHLLVQESQAESRLEYQMMALQVQAGQMQIKNIKSQYLPSLSLFASYEQNAQRNSFDFSDFDLPWYETSLWGLRLNLPIFDGFQKSYKIQQEKIKLRKLTNEQNHLVDALAIEVKTAQAEYLNAYNARMTQSENLQLANKVFNAAQVKYNAGMGSSIELSTSENTLAETRTLYINSLYALLMAKINLEKSLGRYN